MTLSSRFAHWVAALALTAAACTDSTAPDSRELVTLFDLSAPESAGPSDTIRIGFSYAIGCGLTPRVDVAILPTRVTVAAWQEGSPILCRALMIPMRAEVVLPPAGRGPDDVEVLFRQPGGVDSLRTVRSELLAVRAR